MPEADYKAFAEKYFKLDFEKDIVEKTDSNGHFKTNIV